MLCCREERILIFFDARRRDTENFGQIFWSTCMQLFFFLPQHKTQQTKKRTNFFQNRASFFLSFIFIIVVTLLWCLSATFRRPRRKFLRALLSKNRERERERESLSAYISFWGKEKKREL